MTRKAPDRFEHESLQSAETIGAYLEAIAEGIRAGELTVESDDEQLVLHPAGMLDLRVRARQKKEGRARLELRIDWQQPGTEDEDGELRIRSSSSEDE